MITSHTVDSLRAFSERVAEAFNAGKIRAPVHLSGGNESQLIEVFQSIAHDDWVCGSWRSHYHCLLKGVPEDELFAAILSKRSITLCFPDYHIVSSAIVGGVLPIALGLAWSIRRSGGNNRVHAFMGDMTSTTGIAQECSEYSDINQLPVHWIIEDNGKSVCTPTNAAWGYEKGAAQWAWNRTHYKYELPWPHSGAGKRIQF